ncbi:granulysin [Myotis myotis]|uniref:Granulysin n=1 Tax=Myotis myotis TaxID=51298 RepID=A0A7J7U529_MYOMY|nr:granulysin [Myotis myotis]KAF6307918.1 granulysin [Myotis myotis]
MASWVLLLLASALLGSPGLAFSGVTPECSDLAMAPLGDGEQLFLCLVQGGPQGDLPTTREGKGITCRLCQWIIQKLMDMVGEQPDEDTIAQAVSRVCSKVNGFLRGLCKHTMRKSLQRISKDIMAGKGAREVCVDIRICKPQAGLLLASGSSLERKHKNSSPGSWPLLPS